MVSVNVTYHVQVPVGSPAAVTTGRMVMEVSELTVTLEIQFASFRNQATLPLFAPTHVKVTWLTLLKLLPLAESIA